MRWTERQRAMLREMGIRLWLPDDPPGAEDEMPVAAAALASHREHGARAHAIGAEGRAAGVAATALAERAPASADEGRAGDARRDAPHRANADPSPREDRRAFARGNEAAREPMRVPGLAAADWLVVGEPLDAADPQQQLLLENMLRAIGVALVAPTREQRAVYMALDAGAAVDESAAQVRAALGVVAPRCVLAFGRAAAGVLLGDNAPLGALRGRVHAHAGVPVVVTFALAFLLRHPAEKAKAWADLCLAVRARAAPGA